MAKSTEPVLWPYESGGGRKSHHRSSAMVLIAAMAMVFLSVGYVFSEPNRSQAVVTSMATVCEKALAKTKSWLRNPEDGEQPSSEWAQNDGVEPNGPRSGSRIRVTEIHDPTETPIAKASSSTQPAADKDSSQQTQLARVSTVPIIPESLRTPVPLVGGPLPSKTNSSLLAALQPVDLPEELSQRLLLEKVEPSYPARAVQAGLQGPVVLRAWIGKDGKIEDLKLIRGSFLLGEAAYHAVKQWKYKPYLLNGQAVETETYVTVNFKLP